MDKIISHGHTDLAAEPVVSPEVAAERAALEKFELGRFLLANLGLKGIGHPMSFCTLIGDDRLKSVAMEPHSRN